MTASRRLRAAVSFAALLLAAYPDESRGQDLAAGERAPRFLYADVPGKSQTMALDIGRTPILTRKIALNLDGATVREALAAIAQRSGVTLIYGTETLPKDTRVRIRAEEITVAAALTDVLLNSGIDVVFTRSGSAALVKRGPGGAPQLVGIVVGRVTDSSTAEGIQGVSVLVQGTRLSATTGSDGAYAIHGVPAGPQLLMARRLGYRTLQRSIQVADTGRTSANFALAKTPTVLNEIVVTPAGDRQRLEVGNAIGTIKADSLVQTNLIRNISDLLQARTPGVVVSNTSGLVGAPSKVRVRGINSISLNNDPIIIVDGVRLVSQTSVGTSISNISTQMPLSQTNVGSPTGARVEFLEAVQFDRLAPSRLDDIDPNTIESIDILRGPSASSLYGTEAANGVIVIKTKRGVGGSWRATLLADEGRSHVPGRFPDYWRGWGHTLSGSLTDRCFLRGVAEGSCVQDSVTSFNPQNDPQQRTLGTGTSRNVSGSLSGGSEHLQQYLSVRVSDNVGMAKMSELERRRIDRMWTAPPPSWMIRPNRSHDVNATSRTSIRASDRLKLSLSVSGAYRDVLNGGAALPINGLRSFTGTSPSRGPEDTLRYLPSESQRARQSNGVKRAFASAGGTYNPNSWLSVRATLGGDYTARADDALLRERDCTREVVFISSVGANAGSAGCRSGRARNAGEVIVTSADLGAQATFAPVSAISLRTAVGQQVARTQFYGMNVSSGGLTNLAFGSDLLSPAPVPRSGTPQLYGVSESRDEGVTAGWYVEETAAIRGRLFVTAALRQDAASAFGRNVNENLPVYPKYSLSWLLSDEPFFPTQRIVRSARLRSAFGHSGNQASQRNVLNRYQAGTMIVDGVTAPVIVMSQLGNPDLRPERTREWEGGFDISLFDSERLRVELTQYQKTSVDAIMSIMLPPSFGVGGFDEGGTPLPSLNQSVNVGSVRNTGTELSAEARIIDAPWLGWNVLVNWSKNANKLLKKDPSVPQSVSGVTLREGYPLFGYWRPRLVSYADVNGDGILARNEITFGESAFLGAPYPTSEITYATDATFAGGALRVGMNLDQINGQSNQGTNGPLERGWFDRTSSLATQALGLASLAAAGGSYEDPATTLRVSEVSITYNAPSRLARRVLRARSASATVAGRNLAYWTTYRRGDPNVDTSNRLSDAFTQNNGSGVPQPRMWTMRVNLGF